MKKILVVDDENDILELVEVMLNSSGYQVIKSNSGEEALNIVQKDHVDLVLLDAVMPEVSGFDVCRTMKKNQDTRIIPIIMFTALGTGVKLMFEKHNSPNAYMSKPFSKKTLIENIQKLVG